MSARVLVVDDIEANVRLLEAKLLIEYYDVITASNGLTALKMARERMPDIILLDVMMPQIDGFEVCRRLKADPELAHIPVIMVTALSDVRDRVEGLRAGADDFLTKPVNDVALYARIRSLVRLKRASDELRTRETTILQFGAESSDDRPDGAPVTGDVLLLHGGRTDDRVLRLLQELGHIVTVAEDADALVAAAADGDFDLILANDTAENDDTLRLSSRLRSQAESRMVPILLFIHEGDEQRLAKALEIGINDYLVKPVDREELCARVVTQIRRKRYEDALRRNYQTSITAAVTDSLTGLNNRRYLEAHFQAVEGLLAESEKPISLLMLDVDHFKSVNDQYGHPVGDEILSGIAQRIRDGLRSFDTAARYGGEEFVVLMPNTQHGAAEAVAERLCASIGGRPFKVDHEVGELTVTVSVGVTSGLAGSMPLVDFVRQADEALYEAKRSGRNRVISAASAGGAKVAAT